MEILSLINENGDKKYIGYTDNQSIVRAFIEIINLTNKESEVWIDELDSLTTVRKIKPYELSHPRNQWSVYNVITMIKTKNGMNLEHRMDILHSSYNNNAVKNFVYDYFSEFEGIHVELIEQKLDNLDTALEGYIVVND